MGLILFILCFLMTILLWIIIFDSNRFVIRRYHLENEKIASKLKIVFVSDLHNKQYGRNNENLVRAIRECSPDLLVIGGDLINGIPNAKREVALQFLKEMKQYPMIYANGNHEHRIALYPETYGTAGIDYEKELKEINIDRLVNGKVSYPSENIIFYGSQIDAEYWDKFHAPEMQESYLEKILGKCDQDSYTILLAHKPDYFQTYKKWGADLVLSGHVHGGIVRIPGWKGILSPNIRLFPKYDGGMFQEEGSTMIISRGLGMHTIPFRLFNPGELVEIELTPKEK